MSGPHLPNDLEDAVRELNWSQVHDAARQLRTNQYRLRQDSLIELGRSLAAHPTTNLNRYLDRDLDLDLTLYNHVDSRIAAQLARELSRYIDSELARHLFLDSELASDLLLAFDVDVDLDLDLLGKRTAELIPTEAAESEFSEIEIGAAIVGRWWRLLVVALATDEATDFLGTRLPETVPMREVGPVLEPFTGAVRNFVQETNEALLDEADENFIIGQIKVIDALRGIDGPVKPEQIMTAVGEVTNRLLERGVQPDETVRHRLHDHGLVPPELDLVMAGLSGMVFAASAMSEIDVDEPDPAIRAASLVEAEQHRQAAEEAASAASSESPAAPGWTTRVGNDIVAGASKAAGAAAVAGVLAVGTVAAGEAAPVWAALWNVIQTMARFLY